MKPEIITGIAATAVPLIVLIVKLVAERKKVSKAFNALKDEELRNDVYQICTHTQKLGLSNAEKKKRALEIIAKNCKVKEIDFDLEYWGEIVDLTVASLNGFRDIFVGVMKK